MGLTACKPVFEDSDQVNHKTSLGYRRSWQEARTFKLRTSILHESRQQKKKMKALISMRGLHPLFLTFAKIWCFSLQGVNNSSSELRKYNSQRKSQWGTCTSEIFDILAKISNQ